MSRVAATGAARQDDGFVPSSRARLARWDRCCTRQVLLLPAPPVHVTACSIVTRRAWGARQVREVHLRLWRLRDRLEPADTLPSAHHQPREGLLRAVGQARVRNPSHALGPGAHARTPPPKRAPVARTFDEARALPPAAAGGSTGVSRTPSWSCPRTAWLPGGRSAPILPGDPAVSQSIAGLIACAPPDTPQAHEDLLALKEAIESNSSSTPLMQLQQRSWLMHWSLFLLGNHPNGRNIVADLFFNERCARCTPPVTRDARQLRVTPHLFFNERRALALEGGAGRGGGGSESNSRRK